MLEVTCEETRQLELGKNSSWQVQHLGKFAILDILLPVEEPVRDLVLSRIGHDGDQFLNLVWNG